MRSVSLFAPLLLVMSCGSLFPNLGEIDPGNDPNFTMVPHDDEGMKAYNRKVVVFGIDIYAKASVADANLLHAANVMAQYLDNDEDGEVDDPKVLEAMLDNGAYLVMWKRRLDLLGARPEGRTGQDLGNDETHPEWHANKTGAFDATLEEVWHIITHAGYASAYPETFGERTGTELAVAMDLARGGQFLDIPKAYPTNAWYSYTDRTCDYNCMTTEYFYWAMTSMLGAQENRLEEIGHEWRLNTREKVETQDPGIFSLLTSETYRLPKILPDGTYRR
ncbi:MAG: hypothetical protein AAFQ98_23905 [Bacteroidota bacterium]